LDEENIESDTDKIKKKRKTGIKRIKKKKKNSCEIGHPKIFFDSLDNYNAHFKENHQDMTTENPCKKCEKIYCTLSLLKLHKSEEHGVKIVSKVKKPGFKKGFSCSISHPVEFFQTVEDLNEHVKNEHKEDNAEHSCETCSQKFCSSRFGLLYYLDARIVMGTYKMWPTLDDFTMI